MSQNKEVEVFVRFKNNKVDKVKGIIVNGTFYETDGPIVVSQERCFDTEYDALMSVVRILDSELDDLQEDITTLQTKHNELELEKQGVLTKLGNLNYYKTNEKTAKLAGEESNSSIFRIWPSVDRYKYIRLNFFGDGKFIAYLTTRTGEFGPLLSEIALDSQGYYPFNEDLAKIGYMLESGNYHEED